MCVSVAAAAHNWAILELYLRGDLSSFRLLDFLDEELLDDDRELRSLFELEPEPFDADDADDDLDFKLPLLLSDLLSDFEVDLFGERAFLCLCEASLPIELLLLLTWDFIDASL